MEIYNTKDILLPSIYQIFIWERKCRGAVVVVVVYMYEGAVWEHMISMCQEQHSIMNIAVAFLKMFAFKMLWRAQLLTELLSVICIHPDPPLEDEIRITEIHPHTLRTQISSRFPPSLVLILLSSSAHTHMPMPSLNSYS